MEQNQIKTIVRYENRKLYDKEESKYVTIKQIAAFVRSGRDVVVLDHKTNENITQSTLLVALVETEINSTLIAPIADILKAGGLAIYTQNLKDSKNEPIIT